MFLSHAVFLYFRPKEIVGKRNPRKQVKQDNFVCICKCASTSSYCITKFTKTNSRVNSSTDNPMKLPLAWPVGYFSLYTAKSSGANVCPQGTGFQWSEGSVTNQNRGIWPVPPAKSLSMIGFEGQRYRTGVKFSFCSKTEDPSSEYFSPQWPPGRYCILRKSNNPLQAKCPPSKF